MFFNDNILILSLLIVVLTFMASYRTFPIIIHISVIKNLTASPNERSSHKKKTPHLGGLGISFGAFFISAFFGSLMLDTQEVIILLSIAASLIILFSAGIKDDIIGLSPRLKLLFEVISASIFIFLTDIRIDSFYGLFGINELPITASYLFTIFVFIVIINSYNFIDGIDGLAASIAIIIFSCFLYYFINIKSILAIICISSMLGSILAFLKFNFPNLFALAIKSFYNQKYSNQFLREETNSKNKFYLLPIFILSIGLFFCYNKLSFIFYVKIISLITLYFLVKYILLISVGYIFEKNYLFEEIIFHSFIYEKVAGIFLFPLILIFYYGSFDNLVVYYLINIFLILILNYKWIRLLYLSFFNSSLHKAHIIIYLCTFEVLPLVILIKLFY